MIELKKKQQIVFEALKKFHLEFGEMPSIRELQKAIEFFGLKLKSSRSIFIYLNNLEEAGLIRRNPETKVVEILDKTKMMFIDVPIYGSANCGIASIIAEQYRQGTLKVSKNIIGRKNGNEIFAIQASCKSMNKYKLNGNAIKDGSFVLVDGSYKPILGEKDVPVLAVIDGLATIKLLRYMDEGRIGLFPCSTEKEFSPIFLTSSDDLVINGKVIEVLNT